MSEEEKKAVVKFPAEVAFAEHTTPFQFEPYERSSFEEHEESQILEPDHPLLERFQKSLKEHLEKQLEHLRNEIFELETGAKKKKSSREELGIDTYEAQQLVNRQQRELEMCIVELSDVCAATEQIESQLDEKKDEFTKKRQDLFETEKHEIHLRNEVESLNLLLHQIKTWEDDVESELTINQRIFEKMKKDKRQLADEKRQLDVMVYKLMTEIWRLEEESETIDMQLRVKEEQREKMAEAVAASSVDIETMNSELRCLLRSWNSIIVMISQRDKHYDIVRQDLDELNEKLRRMATEIEQTKKLCEKEMVQNERLTDLKCKIQSDIDNCNHLIEIENKKRVLLETQMDNNQALVDQIEKDIQRLSAENANKSYELKMAVKEFEKITREKVALEEKILKTLEDKLTNHKAAKYLNKLLYQINEKNKDFEITLATLENNNAKLLMDIEAQKYVNDETQRFLDELLKQQTSGENQLKEYILEFEKLQTGSTKKQRDLDLLNMKIDTILSKQGGMEVSPEELKIAALEKHIEDAKQKIKELKRFWLRQQGHVVSLTQQRQEQINDINMLKRQMLLLIQKNLKINDELEAHKKLENKMDRYINNLQNRLTVLNEQLFKKRDNKDLLGKDNDSLQFEYMGKLREAEMDSLGIESDITDIEEDKVNLSTELVELNRVALTWEKKIQMAVETKRNMDLERGEGGEVGNMKAEIHRMNVRLSQLKKAQDKLIYDLEHCISRRDAIITIAEAREKREKGGSEKTRINFTRKLDDMRNKVTQMENEVEGIEKKMESLEEEEQNTEKYITATEDAIKSQEERNEEKRYEIEEMKTLKQKNLEVLVLKQKKLKVYSELSKNRHPYIVYRTESAIKTEIEKHKETNSKLLIVMENLLPDFPNYYHVLTRIQNTLKLPHIHLPITSNM